MKVAILGSGPSGMMAAHAAIQYGLDVVIYDKAPDKLRRNSGVYYLHDDCDLLLDKIILKQGLLGAYGLSHDEIAEEYGLKVYGERVAKVSVLDAVDNHEIIGYNAEQAINRLWDLYEKKIVQKEIGTIDSILDTIAQDFDLVISTIPANYVFPNLNFQYKDTWIKVGTAPKEESFIFYNINPHLNWYRCSAIFGTFVQEFGYNIEKKICSDYIIRDVRKVISSDSLPVYKNVLFVGRFGAWDKIQLTHTVYHKTLDWLHG